MNNFGKFLKNYLDQCDWARDVDSRQSWHYVAFVTEQDDVGDGVVEHWTILDGAGPWVTMVQLLHGHLKERVV